MDKSDLMTRSYWCDQRHWLLGFSVLAMIVNLPLATQFDVWSDPSAITQVWLLFWVPALVAFPTSLLLSSKQELVTISKWSFITAFAGSFLQLVVHRLFTSGMTMDQFRGETLLGASFSAVVGGVGILALGALVVLAGKFIYHKRMGGSGGSATTPEEAVLSEEEYADFDPIEDAKRLLRNASRSLLNYYALVKYVVGGEPFCGFLDTDGQTWPDQIATFTG